MKEKLVSINEIVNDIYDNKKMRDVSLDYIIRKTVQFMQIVGVPNMFSHKTAIIEPVCYRAALPCDFYKIEGVRSGCINQDHVYRAATDVFFLSKYKERYLGFTYQIEGGVIFTSTENDPIEIAYLAIPVDEFGYPMLPDNASFMRALKAFIKKEHFTDLFDEGNLSRESLQLAQQDYAWAVGDCESEFNRMSLDEAESFYNGFSELIIRANEHNKHFVDTGAKEIIRRH